MEVQHYYHDDIKAPQLPPSFPVPPDNPLAGQHLSRPKTKKCAAKLNGNLYSYGEQLLLREQPVLSLSVPLYHLTSLPFLVLALFGNY